MKWTQIKEEEFLGKGTIYGRLTLTGKHYMVPAHGRLRRMVEAECDCGVIRLFALALLRRGDTRSCGCLQRDTAREMMTTHGLTQHPLYDVRQQMLARCYIPENAGYENYGGRGITVCDEWQESFLNFYNWAVENGFQSGRSLDRKDNDGPYSPSNCHFTTREVQNRNKRGTRMFTAFGETKCLFDWGKDSRCVLTQFGLRTRVDSGKWPDFEKALTTPMKDRKEVSRSMSTNRMLTAYGETKCLKAWLEDPRCLVKRDSFRDRLAKGWDAELALSTAPTRDGKNKKAA